MSQPWSDRTVAFKRAHSKLPRGSGVGTNFQTKDQRQQMTIVVTQLSSSRGSTI